MYPLDRVENKRVKRLTWMTNPETLVLPLILSLNSRFAGVLGGLACPHGIRFARTGVILQSSTYCTLLHIYDTCATK